MLHSPEMLELIETLLGISLSSFVQQAPQIVTAKRCLLEFLLALQVITLDRQQAIPTRVATELHGTLVDQHLDLHPCLLSQDEPNRQQVDLVLDYKLVMLPLARIPSQI